MPCTPGMTSCRANCRHRALVNDYRLARYAQERARDDRTHMGRGEAELEAVRLICFKDWLLGTAMNPDVSAP